MARQMMVLRELWRITEMRGGAIYRDEYVEDVWVRYEEAERAPAGFLYVNVSDPNRVTIKTVVVSD